MNISVFKDNQSVVEVNLGSEVLGNLNSDTTFFVGRSPDCHVHLDDKQISREHAEISYNGSAWNIKQLSPFSRVIVNGTPYENKQLAAGDIITVGPYVLNVNLPQVEVSTPAPVEVEEDTLEEVEEAIDVDVDDFDEETVALDSDEVDELSGDEDEDFEASSEDGDDDFEASSDDEFGSDDEFDSDEESFEGDSDFVRLSDVRSELGAGGHLFGSVPC